MFKRIVVLLTVLSLLIGGNLAVGQASGAQNNDAIQEQNPEMNLYDGKYLKQFFSLTKEELISRLGDNYSEGRTTIERSYFSHPYIFYEELGLFFMDPGKVWRIEISNGANINEIYIQGVKPGMGLEEIRDKLGNVEIAETWIVTDAIKAYEINCVIDGLKYTFLSRYKDGRWPILIITEEQ